MSAALRASTGKRDIDGFAFDLRLQLEVRDYGFLGLERGVQTLLDVVDLLPEGRSLSGLDFAHASSE